jgi:5-hydroxyisourate hydrolase-like protein (transthyretin family)
MNLEIKVKRVAKKLNYTVGKMTIDDSYFCDTLEDKVRNLVDANNDGAWDNKVFGETAIPAGRYEVKIGWSNRFKRNMPRIQNVKGFDGILVHNGVSAEHTHGCLLVGLNKVVGKLINSTEIFNLFFALLEKEIAKSKKVFITIED